MSTLTTKENICHIEGILSEVDLAEKSFIKDGKVTEAIGGSIKVRVNEVINGVPTVLEVPVEIFTTKLTNAGTANPAYEAAMRVKNEYVSIAASDIDHADRVRITKGAIKMNEYYNQDQKLISFPRITASFVSKIKPEECHDEATFTLTFIVLKALSEKLDKDGVGTGSYVLTAGVPQYGGKIDVVTLTAVNDGVINTIQSSWNEQDTVKANGKLNFSSKTEVVEIPVDFGESTSQSRTIRVSELIITGGNQNPLEGDFAFDPAGVTEALTARKQHHEELKAKSANKKPATNGVPAAKKGFSDLGF